MKIFIRADSSSRIGGGHIMRCLTLAERLRRDGCDVTFVSREHPGNVLSAVEGRGFRLLRLPCPADDGIGDNSGARHEGWLGVGWSTDAEETIGALEADGRADWVVVDHYSLDWRWESEVRPCAGHMMVIDDLADRRHDCDLLLDQNLYDCPGTKYDSLVPAGCVKLIGPRYALMRDEFVKARRRITRPGREARRILVSFGGTDLTGETIKCIEAIRMLGRPGLTVDVVTGLCQADNMAELMLKADIAIGAAGTTTWERCCLGLPSIVVAVAADQAESAKALGERNIIVNLGWHEDVTPEKVRAAVAWLLSDPRKRMELAECGIKTVDGSGADRVALVMQYKRNAVGAVSARTPMRIC